MKRYSHTQVMMYLRCPQQWAYRYLEGLKMPPQASLAQGRAYHVALETNFKQKIASHSDLPVTEVKEAYAASFDQEIQNGIEWSPEEKSQGPAIVAGQLKDQGVLMVEEHHKELAPKIQPVEVEKPFTIEFSNTDWSLDGRIDLIDDGGMIHDHKTTAKSPSKDESGAYQANASERLQGAVYTVATAKRDGAAGFQPASVAYDYAVKTKQPKIIQVITEIAPKEQEFALSLVQTVDSAIKTGVFVPNRVGQMCSRTQCGFWSKCEADHGGRVKG